MQAEIKKVIMEATNNALATILRKSHEQVLAGNTVSMDEVERFMSLKIYELTNSVDTYCAAESV